MTSANLRYLEVQELMKVCKKTFNWTSFSNDVVMDVGCGEHCNVCRAVIQDFPDVKQLIAIDKNPLVVERVKTRNPKYECYRADIENRQSLQAFEGKVTKLFSYHVFRQLRDKVVGFQNVYYMLKPGGEATIMYHLNSGLYVSLKEIAADPKWHSMYQDLHLEDMHVDIEICRHADTLEMIGFTVAHFAEECRSISYASDQACKEFLYGVAKQTFTVPEAQVEEFKEECFRVFLKHNGRDTEGKARYFDRQVYMLLVKPIEDNQQMRVQNDRENYDERPRSNK